jgi:DNA-binding protein Fis
MRAGTYEEVHEAVDRVLLPKVLEDCGGNITRAAERLEVTRRRLRERMLRLGLYVPKDEGS